MRLQGLIATSSFESVSTLADLPEPVLRVLAKKPPVLDRDQAFGGGCDSGTRVLHGSLAARGGFVVLERGGYGGLRTQVMAWDDEHPELFAFLSADDTIGTGLVTLTDDVTGRRSIATWSEEDPGPLVAHVRSLFTVRAEGAMLVVTAAEEADVTRGD